MAERIHKIEIVGPEHTIVQDVSSLVVDYGYENQLINTRGFYITFNKPGVNPGEFSLGVELQDWDLNREDKALATVSIMDYSQPKEPKIHTLLEIDFEYNAWLRTITFGENSQDIRRKAQEDEIKLFGSYVKNLRAFLDATNEPGHLLTSSDPTPKLTP